MDHLYSQKIAISRSIWSNCASKEQISEPYEIRKKLPSAFDTFTNGTIITSVNSS
jgi:hypothetical protein